MTDRDRYLLRRFLAIYDTLESVETDIDENRWNATVPDFLPLDFEPATGDEGGF